MVLAQGDYVYVCTKFEAAISFGLKVIRGPKISKLVHVTQATPILGSFYIPYAGRVRPPSLTNLQQIAQFV